ncbi:MAG: flagellar hook-basal body protein [Planctomycetaceae bacterium]
MLASLYTAGAGMEAAEALHRTTAHNLARGNQPGFRRLVSVETALLDQPRPGPLSPRLAALEQVDFSSGPFETTGQPLDLAIDAPGFFVLEGPQGPLYTRCGVFQLNAEGILINGDGLPVQGEGGPLTIPGTALLSDLQVTSDGSLQLGNNKIGKLQVVTFEDVSRLRPVGGATFAAPADMPAQQTEGAVLQGVREQSNVQQVQELVSLITASRRYEAAQKALRTIDEATKKRIELN